MATAACSRATSAVALATLAADSATSTVGSLGTAVPVSPVVGVPPTTALAPTVVANSLTALSKVLAAMSCILAAPLNVLTTLSMVMAALCCARPASTINLVSPPAAMRLPCSVSKTFCNASEPVNPCLLASSMRLAIRGWKSAVLTKSVCNASMLPTRAVEFANASCCNLTLAPMC